MLVALRKGMQGLLWKCTVESHGNVAGVSVADRGGKKSIMENFGQLTSWITKHYKLTPMKVSLVSILTIGISIYMI
jgi:hypothetical protein